MKGWVIGVPGLYRGTMNASDKHVKEILESLRLTLAPLVADPSTEEGDEDELR